MITRVELVPADVATRGMLLELGDEVRLRFPAADGIVFSRKVDTYLWQIVAGPDVVWDALLDVTNVPDWAHFIYAADMFFDIVDALKVNGPILVLRLLPLWRNDERRWPIKVEHWDRFSNRPADTDTGDR